jgi:hypothetical protein
MKKRSFLRKYKVQLFSIFTFLMFILLVILCPIDVQNDKMFVIAELIAWSVIAYCNGLLTRLM